MVNYPETEQTYQALIKLKAVNKFVSFNIIFEGVQNIRLSRNLKANPSNLKGRVRRSLINNNRTTKANSSFQSSELSIADKYPKYRVMYKRPISLNEKGLAKDINEVEENSFCLVLK